MTDTVRTQAQLLSFLHPNIGNAAPDATVLQSQAARDLIVSIFPGGVGPDPTAQQATFLGVPISGLPTRGYFAEGNATTPVTPVRTTGNPTFDAHPTVVISRQVKTDPLNVIADGGGLYVEITSFDAGSGPGPGHQPQVNAIQIGIDQLAPTDALGVGSQILMRDPRGGTAYTFYTNAQLYAGQVVTITNAFPAVVSWPNHLQTFGNTLRLGTAGTLPAGLTAGTLYNIVPTGVSSTFYLGPVGFLQVANIASITAGNPTTVHTTGPHGLSTGDSIVFAGTVTTPNINSGIWSITVTGANTFTLPTTTSVGQAGSGGNYTKLINTSSAGSGVHKAWANGGLNAFNPLIANTSGVDFIYDGQGVGIIANILLQTIASDGHLTGTGIELIDSDGSQWDTGIAIGAGAVMNAAIRDWSSAAISFEVRGAHTVGIDLTGGVYSDAAIKTLNNVGSYQQKWARTLPVAVTWGIDVATNGSLGIDDISNAKQQLYLASGTPGAGLTNLFLLGTSGAARQVGFHNDGTRDLLYLV